MKKIHIAGAGGVAGIGMTRCLQQCSSSGEPEYQVQGHDSSTWGTYAMECLDEIDPLASGAITLSDMVIPIADPLVKKWADSDLCFLPSREIVEICQDKAKTAQLLSDLAPKVFWVRDTVGAGGSGAQMAQELLPGRNHSAELLYNRGVLIGHFIKERLAYDIKGRKDPLWQRGSSVVSICVREPGLLYFAEEAVRKVHQDRHVPHGVFAVDFKDNEQGEPKITEINPGRFLTASYPFFYSRGYNLPMLMVKTFFGEKYELGPYPEGWGVIRQQDSLPKWFSPGQTKEWR